MKFDVDAEKRIVAAARTEFTKHGRSGARTQAIADGAGVNKALLHYYFRNKKQLFVRVVEDVFREVITFVDGMSGGDEPFRVFLRGFIEGYFTFLRQNSDLTLFLLWEFSHEPEVFQQLAVDSFQENRTTPLHMLRKKIKESMRKGEIREVNPVSFFFNFLSLAVFFHLLMPLVKSMNHIPGLSVDRLLEERKEEVFRILWNDVKLGDDT
jgi:TetR/AcrR family transcriptional regulator